MLGVRPEIGPLLAAIVDRAMAWDPALRFGSASEMAAALFAVMSQLPEELTCPVRGGNGPAPPRNASPRPVIPGGADVSADLLAPTSATSQPDVAPPLASWLTRPSTWWAAGSGALAIAILLVASSMLRPARPRQAVRPPPIAADTMPAVVPIELPAVPAATDDVPEARDRSATASAERAVDAAAMRAAERAHAPAPEPPRPKRPRAARPKPKPAEPPPEAFTNPGF